MPESPVPLSKSVMLCLICKSRLEASGREPFRYVCSNPNCGQHFYAVMRLVPVEADQRLPELPGADVAESSTGTG